MTIIHKSAKPRKIKPSREIETAADLRNLASGRTDYPYNVLSSTSVGGIASTFGLIPYADYADTASRPWSYPKLVGNVYSIRINNSKVKDVLLFVHVESSSSAYVYVELEACGTFAFHRIRRQQQAGAPRQLRELLRDLIPALHKMTRLQLLKALHEHRSSLTSLALLSRQP